LGFYEEWEELGAKLIHRIEVYGGFLLVDGLVATLS
jgi:hypothetical protein